MKNKYSNIILSIIVGIILGLAILGIKNLINIDTKSIGNNLEQKISESIQAKTPKELIYETLNMDYNINKSNKEKIAYITIDDGPSKYTNQILDILDKNNIKGTFFMIDGNMKKRPKEVQRISQDGHAVGFHSVSHEINVLYKTPQTTLDEFNTCNKTYKNITDKESRLVRLPYGSKPYTPEDSYKILVNNSYLLWDWNLDTQDWKGTTDNIVSNILYYGRNRNNLVVLLHEKEQSVNALEGIIKVLKSRGYTILPITENIQPLNYWQENL